MQYNQVRTGQPNYSGSRYMISTAMRLCNTSDPSTTYAFMSTLDQHFQIMQGRENEVDVLVTGYDDLVRVARLPGASPSRALR